MNDGGPAFPIRANCETIAIRPEKFWDTPEHEDMTCSGMSLRDYFAAAALQGIIAGAVPLGELNDGIKNVIEAQAEAAYIIADAMLAAREGKQ